MPRTVMRTEQLHVLNSTASARKTARGNAWCRALLTGMLLKPSQGCGGCTRLVGTFALVGCSKELAPPNPALWHITGYNRFCPAQLDRGDALRQGQSGRGCPMRRPGEWVPHPDPLCSHCSTGRRGSQRRPRLHAAPRPHQLRSNGQALPTAERR